MNPVRYVGLQGNFKLSCAIMDKIRGRNKLKGTSVLIIRLFGFATFTATLKLVSRVGLP